MKVYSLTQKDLQEVFEFVNGELWRKECVRSSDGLKYPRKMIKNVANTSGGYCLVWFKDKALKYHRIIWTLLNGDIPEGMQIDHIDGDRLNNNVNNLRLVSSRGNGQNRIGHRNGKLVGCTYCKQNRKWKAQIKVNGKQKYLGLFDTEQEAHEAYLKALKEIEQCEFL